MLSLQRIARHSVLSLATLVLVASVAVLATPAHAATLNWSSRTVIDHHPPFPTTHPLAGISCPSAGLCVAVDTGGSAAVSSDPTGAHQNGCTLCSWTSVDIDSAHSLVGVTCPSVSLCVAIDDAGDVLTSTDPGGSHAQWTVTNVDGTTPLNSISCVGVTLCVAVDDAGAVVSSGNPTGGPAAWNVAVVDAGVALRASPARQSLFVLRSIRRGRR